MPKEPFLQDNIIVRFLKKAPVESLKVLRKMDEKWLHLDNLEFEKRSEKGQFKPLQFSKEHFKEDLDLFLKDTGSNPEFFRSFRLGFQDAFKFLDSSFFALYRPQFLQLELPDKMEITQAAGQYLGELLGWISKDIQELKVQVFFYENKVLPVAFHTPPVFPNLTKFTYRQPQFTPISYIQHFSCILDRSREVDPSPNLTTLEVEPKHGDNLEDVFGSNPTTLSRWSTLTHLSLGSQCNIQRITSMLLSLASAGMSLQSLSLNCEIPKAGLDFVANCSDFSRFLNTQAKSLKILKLRLHLAVAIDEIEPFGVKICWPIFENVHTLKLKYPFFDMGPIPVHFPSLQNLNFDTLLSVSSMFPDGIQPLSIPTLSIGDWPSLPDNENGFKSADAWIDWLEGKFEFVVHLTCSNRLVEISSRGLPWSDTLEVLEIKRINSPIKVGHLKALKTLVIDDMPDLKFVKAWFKEALVLNLSSITFKRLSAHIPSDELKDEFRRYFPYPVKFQEITLFD